MLSLVRTQTQLPKDNPSLGSLKYILIALRYTYEGDRFSVDTIDPKIKNTNRIKTDEVAKAFGWVQSWVPTSDLAVKNNILVAVTYYLDTLWQSGVFTGENADPSSFSCRFSSVFQQLLKRGVNPDQMAAAIRISHNIIGQLGLVLPAYVSEHQSIANNKETRIVKSDRAKYRERGEKIASLLGQIQGVNGEFELVGEPIDAPRLVEYHIRQKGVDNGSAIVPVNTIVAKAGESLLVYGGLETTRPPIAFPSSGKIVLQVDKPHHLWRSLPLDAYLKEIGVQWVEGVANDLCIHLGKTPSGEVIKLDLAGSLTPHVSIFGSTGGGKNGTINAIVEFVCRAFLPTQVQFLMIDTRGSQMSQFAGLPWVKGGKAVKEIDDIFAAFEDLVAEAERRDAAMAKANCGKIAEWNKEFPERAWPRIIILFDEISKVKKSLPVDAKTEDGQPPVLTQKIFDYYMEKIAREFRSVGIHIIACTQSPSADKNGVYTPEFRENVSTAIALFCRPETARKGLGFDFPQTQNLQGDGDAFIFLPGHQIPTRCQIFYSPKENINQLRKDISHPSVRHLFANVATSSPESDVWLDDFEVDYFDPQYQRDVYNDVLRYKKQGGDMSSNAIARLFGDRLHGSTVSEKIQYLKAINDSVRERNV